MILEYLKLARLSIVTLTGIAPVMGALATSQFQFINLILLFFIGFFGHAYGMTHNDLIDYIIDKNVPDISDRPLLSGTISIKQARIFALFCLVVMFILALILSFLTKQYFSLIFLIIPVICVTIYNIISKKIPFADILLSIGMFFFIFYGAQSQQFGFYSQPILVWIICFFGAIQMLSINIIAGGFKDVETDAKQKVKTGVMILGLQIIGNKLYIPRFFAFVTYAFQLLIIAIAYLPFILIHDFFPMIFLRYFSLGLITIIGISMIIISHNYLTLDSLDRGRVRMLFNLQGFVNFTIAPILLLSITPFAIILIPIPVIVFYISTILYHEKFMQPASM
jgi:4-hydroxybenzoate polyprenyltransferase